MTALAAKALYGPVTSFPAYVEYFSFFVRIICILTSIAYFAGNLVYSILSLFPEDSRYWILMVARFAIGVSSGTKRIETKAGIIVNVSFSLEPCRI